MELSRVKRRAKFITNANGRPVAVVIPYEAYREYMDMKISLEFYESLETQESIRRAKEDLSTGRFKDYPNVEQLIKDLHG